VRDKVAIPSRALFDRRMKGTHLRTLGVLCGMASGEGKCFPSMTTLAVQSGSSRRDVQRTMRDLEQFGYIRRRERIADDGGDTSAEFTVLFAGDGAVAQPAGGAGEITAPGAGEITAGGAGEITAQTIIPPSAPKGASSPKGDLPRKGSRLPEGWDPAEQTIAWAKQNHPSVNLRAEHESFTDYWRAKAGRDAVKTDWDATWRNWIRRATTDRLPRGSPAKLPERKPLAPAYGTPEWEAQQREMGLA
jgi:DNA-binding transcriptional MocR family regulator